MAFNGTETWTLGKLDRKYLESFEMWCWRRMGITRNHRVRNGVVGLLHKFKGERNSLQTTKRNMANWDWSHIT